MEDNNVEKDLETAEMEERKDIEGTKPELNEGDLVIGYVRKSVKREDEQTQIAYLDRFIEERRLKLSPYSLDQRYFIETKSGLLDESKRKVLKEAKDRCKTEPIKAVLAMDLSRFSREGIRAALNHVADFNKHGTYVYSVLQGWMLIIGYGGGIMNELTVAMYAFAAALEARITSEKVTIRLKEQKTQIAEQGYFINKKGEKKFRSAGRVERQPTTRELEEIERQVKLAQYKKETGKGHTSSQTLADIINANLKLEGVNRFSAYYIDKYRKVIKERLGG